MQTQDATQTLKRGRPLERKGGDSPRFALTLPAELRERIRKDAAENGITEAEMIRRYLLRGIEKTVSVY